MVDETKLAQSPEDKKAAAKAAAGLTQPEAKIESHEAKTAATAEGKTDKKNAKEIIDDAKKDAKTDKNAKPKREVILERRFTVTLIKAYAKPQTRRTPTALKMLRKLCARHMKSTPEAVKIDGKLAAFAAGPGGKRPAKKLTVLAQKDKSGMVHCVLAPMSAAAPAAKKA